MTRTRLIAALLGALCILLSACAMGYKDWPQPQSEEDRFSWRLVTAERQAGCLVIEGRLQGAYKNLSSVTVQLQELGPGGGCVECPFDPQRFVELASGDEAFEEIGPYVRLVVCDLKKSAAYKFRLAGYNALRTMRPTFSNVQVASP